jgi:large subunit ribosomal protein L3
MNFAVLGTKLGMTQVFDSSGCAFPVTIIKVGPCQVTQIKTLKTDGYTAVQLGYLKVKPNALTKPRLRHLEKQNNPPLKILRESRVDSIINISLGEVFSADNFSIGDIVCVTGKTIGKGFAGTIKKHNFTRGPMTHGSKNHREPGSIGMGTTPGRVYPGKRMAGRLGGMQCTIKNLPIILVNIENNLMAVKGSVPGKIGNLLTIKKCRIIKNN